MPKTEKLRFSSIFTHFSTYILPLVPLFLILTLIIALNIHHLIVHQLWELFDSSSGISSARILSFTLKISIVGRKQQGRSDNLLVLTMVVVYKHSSSSRQSFQRFFDWISTTEMAFFGRKWPERFRFSRLL